jgi:hypothetical protein
METKKILAYPVEAEINKFQKKITQERKKTAWQRQQKTSQAKHIVSSIGQ